MPGSPRLPTSWWTYRAALAAAAVPVQIGDDPARHTRVGSWERPHRSRRRRSQTRRGRHPIVLPDRHTHQFGEPGLLLVGDRPTDGSGSGVAGGAGSGWGAIGQYVKNISADPTRRTDPSNRRPAESPTSPLPCPNRPREASQPTNRCSFRRSSVQPLSRRATRRSRRHAGS